MNLIQTKTGVQITIPRREQQETTFEPVDATEDDLDAEEEMVSIDIEGDVESINAAKEEINAIISKVCGSSKRVSLMFAYLEQNTVLTEPGSLSTFLYLSIDVSLSINFRSAESPTA